MGVVRSELKMPKVICRCGDPISISDIPCSDEWLMISDAKYESFGEKGVNAECLYREMTHVLKCPSCDRLLVFWDSVQAPFSSCKLEKADG